MGNAQTTTKHTIQPTPNLQSRRNHRIPPRPHLRKILLNPILRMDHHHVQQTHKPIQLATTRNNTQNTPGKYRKGAINDRKIRNRHIPRHIHRRTHTTTRRTIQRILPRNSKRHKRPTPNAPNPISMPRNARHRPTNHRLPLGSPSTRIRR